MLHNLFWLALLACQILANVAWHYRTLVLAVLLAAFAWSVGLVNPRAMRARRTGSGRHVATSRAVRKTNRAKMKALRAKQAAQFKTYATVATA